MELKTFKNGIHPTYYKELTQDKATEVMPLPKQIIIPLQQHIGAPCKPTVKLKDEVQVGDLIGDSEAFVSSPVHSSISGVVKKIEPRPHPGGSWVNSIVIDANEADQTIPPPKEHREVASLSPDEIRTAVKNAGLVGLGGAGFPTHIKLNPPKGKTIDTVIINGAECEPYLTSDHRMMLEQPEDVIYGTKLIMRAFGLQKG
jgi:electron transport complex protein RnfC